MSMRRGRGFVWTHSSLSVGLFVFIRIWTIIRFLDYKTQRAAIEILKKQAMMDDGICFQYMFINPWMSFDTRWKRFLNLTAFNRESTLIFNWSLNEYVIDIFHSFGCHAGRSIVPFFYWNRIENSDTNIYMYSKHKMEVSNKLYTIVEVVIDV